MLLNGMNGGFVEYDEGGTYRRFIPCAVKPAHLWAGCEALFVIWRGCEEGYKLQKIALELENFSGKGFLTLLQDFWSMILIVNIFQTGCLEEEGPWDISSPPTHRINKSVVFGSLREAAFLMILGEMSAAEFQKRF